MMIPSRSSTASPGTSPIGGATGSRRRSSEPQSISRGPSSRRGSARRSPTATTFARPGHDTATPSSASSARPSRAVLPGDPRLELEGRAAVLRSGRAAALLTRADASGPRRHGRHGQQYAGPAGDVAPTRQPSAGSGDARLQESAYSLPPSHGLPAVPSNAAFGEHPVIADASNVSAAWGHRAHRPPSDVVACEADPADVSTSASLPHAATSAPYTRPTNKARREHRMLAI